MGRINTNYRLRIVRFQEETNSNRAGGLLSRTQHTMSLPREDNPSSDNGNDFTYNFISDLGPLLALFGERVAQQFMSQSMGWADNIIFAMGPLGIITAIVAAIRVGGPSWLKAIIGRARENRANAEVELMSSTSHEVCELWNGQQIVRILGSPEVKELIYISGAVPAPDGRGILNFYTLDQAEKDKQVEVVDGELIPYPTGADFANKLCRIKPYSKTVSKID